MKILKVTPQTGFTLLFEFDDGSKGVFDVAPYLKYEAFEPLNSEEEFF